MKKKFLSILLATVMVISMLPVLGTAVSAEATETIVLETKDEVVKFFNEDMLSSTFKGQTVQLGCDVDFSDVTLVARNTVKIFEGTFDGNGHVISNLTFVTNGNACGLFGPAAPSVSPTIKNVAFINCTVNSNSWQAGLLYGGDANIIINISNVYVKNLTHNQNNKSNDCYGGGLVGYLAVNCNNVVVTSYSQSLVKGNNRFGGFAGKIKAASTFTNCAFYGKLTTSNGAGFVAEQGDFATLNDCISIIETGSSSMRPYAYGCTSTNGVFNKLKVAENAAVLTMTGFGGGRNTEIPGIKAYDTASYIGIDAQEEILAANNMDDWTATTIGYPMPVSIVKTFPSLFENTVSDSVLKFHGYQTTTVSAENTLSLRLIATIAEPEANLASYKQVGFKIAANYGNSANINKVTVMPSSTVYTSITANYGAKQYTTSDLLGDNTQGFIFALAIANVPTDKGAITFDITPYYVDQNDNVVNGSTHVITVDEFPAPELPASN